MSKKELYKRYFLFLCSIFINSFSIAVITKAALGYFTYIQCSVCVESFHPIHDGTVHDRDEPDIYLA